MASIFEGRNIYVMEVECGMIRCDVVGERKSVLLAIWWWQGEWRVIS